MNKNNSSTILKEIIETSYHLLIKKIANGGIVAKNEAAFQLEFGYILKTIGDLYEFGKDHKFDIEFESYITLMADSIKSKSKIARVDLLLNYTDGISTTKGIIELKFFKKENQREPNNRYDVFKDISNLESYKENGIDLCYFILATDHLHYVDQEDYSDGTSDFDFRNGKNYKAGDVLSYTTKKPYGPDLSLKSTYNFTWDRSKEFNFLKLEV